MSVLVAPWEEIASLIPEKRLALIHRVIEPHEDYPREYAILVTDRRSIFIRQRKTRAGFVLRGEMRYGTALVTDVIPKTLEDYEQNSEESLTADNTNLTVPHEEVVSLVMRNGEPKFRMRDLFIWLTMRRQGHKFSVYDFEMNYRPSPDSVSGVKFYMVPLGAYFKPRRQSQSRETILREYAMDALEIFRKVFPAAVIAS